jgi:hypothetical protein
MTSQLTDLTAEWDRNYEAALPVSAPLSERRPYGSLLDPLETLAHLRFQPYQNDNNPSFSTRLTAWIEQFAPADRRFAFLLALRIVFITPLQFESLQRRLFRTCIRRHLLDTVIKRDGHAIYDYVSALPKLRDEMDATLFVANSESSQINAFIHKNIEFFENRQARSLIGPPLSFWTYAAERRTRRGTTPRVVRVSRLFERVVLASDHRLKNKRRLIVIEDFSGSGSDLRESLLRIVATELPFEEIVLAPVLITEHAFSSLHSLCTRYSSPKRAYTLLCASRLPESLRCFDGPNGSYLDGTEPVQDLSIEIKRLSQHIHAQHFANSSTPLAPNNAHGFGGLALAFVLHTNCPDNSLPLIWKDTPTWRSLFRRASRYI